jgi:hypothetical protein
MSYTSQYKQSIYQSFDKLTLDQALQQSANESYSSPYFKLKDTSFQSFMINSQLRQKYVKKYSWAIPTREVIDTIYNATSGKSILEVGAGNGFWASLLTKRGSTIIPTDSFESHGFTQDNTFMPIENLEAVQAIQAHPECEALMLVWPPYDTDMAEKALKAFKGSTVIYIGEGHGGCNANDAFFNELHKNWDELRTDDDACVPNWDGIHDYLQVHQRK